MHLSSSSTRPDLPPTDHVARELLKRGARDAALRLLRAAIARDPNERACAALLRAIEARPDAAVSGPGVRLDLALVDAYSCRGMLVEARAVLSGSGLDRAGEGAARAAVLDELLAPIPSGTDLELLDALRPLASGGASLALSMLEEIAARQPLPEWAARRRSLLRELLLDPARLSTQDALETDADAPRFSMPGVLTPVARAVGALFEQRDLVGALRHLREHVEATPDDTRAAAAAEALAQVIAALDRRGDGAPMANGMRTVPMSLRMTADFNVRMGNFVEAERLYRRIWLDGADPDVAEMLRCLEVLRRFTERAVDTGATPSAGVVRDALATPRSEAAGPPPLSPTALGPDGPGTNGAMAPPVRATEPNTVVGGAGPAALESVERVHAASAAGVQVPDEPTRRSSDPELRRILALDDTAPVGTVSTAFRRPPSVDVHPTAGVQRTFAPTRAVEPAPRAAARASSPPLPPPTGPTGLRPDADGAADSVAPLTVTAPPFTLPTSTEPVTAPVLVKRGPAAAGPPAGQWSSARSERLPNWAEDDSTEVVSLERNAELLLKKGFHERALAAYRELRVQHPTEGRYVQRIAEIEELIRERGAPVADDVTVRRDMGPLVDATLPTGAIRLTADLARAAAHAADAARPRAPQDSGAAGNLEASTAVAAATVPDPAGLDPGAFEDEPTYVRNDPHVVTRSVSVPPEEAPPARAVIIEAATAPGAASGPAACSGNVPPDRSVHVSRVIVVR